MAKLPSLIRLLVEDFPDQKEWIGKLLQPLNQFMESTAASINKSLTVQDNIDQQYVEVSITGNASSTFKATTKNRPSGVSVINVVTVSGTAPTAAVQPIWEYVPATNSIKVTSWYGGLNSSSKYKITLHIHTV